MRGVTGVAGVIVEVDGFLIVADGGFIPLGFGNRDDAVEISLVIDRSDGVGDDARCAPFSADAFTSLIFAYLC